MAPYQEDMGPPGYNDVQNGNSHQENADMSQNLEARYVARGVLLYHPTITPKITITAGNLLDLRAKKVHYGDTRCLAIAKSLPPTLSLLNTAYTMAPYTIVVKYTPS
jgi:hypothetical protein